MAQYKQDQEYLQIIDNILKKDDFRKIETIKHHNTNRLNHSIKVSYYSYKIAKTLKLDYKDVARGGLLHDFYTDKISECNSVKDKIKLFSTGHPKDAVNNALTYFDLTDKEINIIETHMFPMDYRVPKYIESWIVSIVDKVLSFGEILIKYSYKIAYVFNLYFVFLLNIIK